MNRWLASLPIRGKLILLAALSSSLSLLIAGTILTWVNYSSKVESLLHRLQTQAEITALNSTAAVAFDDTAAALRTLNALTADKATISAQIERADGSILAQAGFRFQPESASSADYVQVRADVVLDGRIGSVVLTASKAELRATILQHGMILLLVMAVAFATALLAAARLQRVISGPIMALADTATRVSRERDFSLRVPHQSGDEVGRLVTSFNDMLEQIEVRDQQLRTYHADLEAKVASRTEELAAALEDAQAAARAKTNFLANMSHEIRTPMNGVLGMLGLMDTSRLSADQRNMLETARNSAEALLTLINDVLDFSKIDAGKLTLEQIDFEVRPLVEEITTLLARQAHAKGIEVACLVNNSVPAFLMGDPTRLRQIIANLVSNAIKFTQRGEVSLTLSCKDCDSSEPIVRIEVRDTGIGIAPEALPNLFKAFTQADTSTTRKFGGTGLGLAITQRLVEAMCGSIKVESTPGKGSTFTVEVPLRASKQTKPLRATHLGDLKALVIDDNATNRHVLEHYLSAWGVEFTCVDSAQSGLTAARETAQAGKPFNVVLVDYQMPEMDGLAFIQQLRSDPAIARTDCIVLSSLGDRVADADTLGVSAWLTKPLRYEQLFSTLGLVAGRTATFQAIAPVSNERVEYRARVLLVEDHRVNQEVARRMLRLFGIEPELAENGAEAVERVRAERYDLILMDCQMPVMDGYVATRMVRQFERESGRPPVPIVAMTANAMPGDRERCLAVGMNDYIAKPIDRSALASILAQWLGAAATTTSAEIPQEPAEPEPESVLDMAKIEQMRELFDGDISEVVEAFLADTPKQLAAMESAIFERDHATLKRAAHNLKSTSRSLGVPAMGELAFKLETLAQTQGDMSHAASLLASLRASAKATEPALRAAMRGNGSAKSVSSA